MTLDHLLQLSPDAKTLEAGRRLFYSRRWQLLGGDGEWLWGEFSVSNAKYLTTAVDLSGGRFHCSCRARQRPCAHGLALVLLLKNDADRLVVGQPPSWVRSVQFQAERKPRVTQDVTRADERLTERLALMTEGVNELELRLIDVARRGLADTLARGPDIWLSAAARLTDAKLPGPAGRLRRLAYLPETGRETEISRTLGDLYLFVRAWRRGEALGQDRWQEVLQVAGLSGKKDELLDRPGVTDHWLVLGVQIGQEDKLRSRRVWLRGEKSRRFALLLDFAFGERPFEQSWPLGGSFDGSLHFYPGSYSQRAIFPSPRVGGRPYDGLRGYPGIAEMLENYRKALVANPWLWHYPVYFPALTPRFSGDGIHFADGRGRFLPVPAGFEAGYDLLAISGGHPISVFGEFDGYVLRVMSVVTGSGVVAI